MPTQTGRRESSAQLGCKFILMHPFYCRRNNNDQDQDFGPKSRPDSTVAASSALALRAWLSSLEAGSEAAS